QPLPACSVCLGCFHHNIIYCNTTQTWDKAHLMFAECHHAALYTKNGQLLFCKWQRMKDAPTNTIPNTCSSCGSASHRAQCCPHAQRPHTHNTL
ncbi:hypothetical protein PAXRUDRAFT_180370, partial [Paxillus rubicundulus Ve08.2h10]